jgi:hypothetical protein
MTLAAGQPAKLPVVGHPAGKSADPGQLVFDADSSETFGPRRRLRLRRAQGQEELDFWDTRGHGYKTFFWGSK